MVLYLYMSMLLFCVRTIACVFYIQDKRVSVVGNNKYRVNNKSPVKRIRHPHNKDNKNIENKEHGGTIVNYNREC